MWRWILRPNAMNHDGWPFLGTFLDIQSPIQLNTLSCVHIIIHFNWPNQFYPTVNDCPTAQIAKAPTQSRFIIWFYATKTWLCHRSCGPFFWAVIEIAQNGNSNRKPNWNSAFDSGQNWFCEPSQWPDHLHIIISKMICMCIYWSERSTHHQPNPLRSKSKQMILIWNNSCT